MKTTMIALVSGVASAVLAQAAAAQTTPPPTPASAGTTAQAAPAIGEVIVTAQKRKERVQDIPSSVDVVDAAQLARQNVVAVADLVRTTPGLNTAGPYGALSIRGIGSVGFSRSSEGSVGVVIDGVALAGASTNPPQLFDVARVEVLEGPQGTLFGRNSSAGVINVTTNAPSPSAFEALAHVDIGTRDDRVARAVVNLPLSDNAALRVSGSFSEGPENQYNRSNDTYNDPKQSSLRARLLWEPTSDITINLIADYSQVYNNGGAPWTVYAATPGSQLSTGLAACGVQVKQSNDQGCVNGGNDIINTTFGTSAQIDWRVGGYTLSSITSYRASPTDTKAYDVDSLPTNLYNQSKSENTENRSEELRLTSPIGGLLDYVAGLYYFNSDYKGQTTDAGPILAFSGLPFVLGQTLSTDASETSYAAYAQGAIHLTPAFRINLGARIGSEAVDANTTGVLAPKAVAPVQNISGIHGSASDKYFSYRAGLQYDFSHNLMVYGTYARGYKGPAINDQAGGVGIPVLVKPEIPNTGEIGVKSTLFDGRLVADAAIFHTRVTNFQSEFYDPAVEEFIFGNAPSLTSQGVELNFIGRPIDGLTLNLGATYDDAKYGSGYEVSCAQLQTLAQGCTPVFNASGVKVGSEASAAGNRLVGAPKWKVTANGEYARPINDRYEGFLQVDAVYTSTVNWDQAYDPLLKSPPATIIGGKLGVRTSDRRFGMSLFVRNLFDVYRPATRFAAPTAAQTGDPQAYVQIAGPESRRVIGVTLDGHF